MDTQQRTRWRWAAMAAALTMSLPTLHAQAQGSNPNGYLDGSSICFLRDGSRVCAIFSGPYQQVGEASYGPMGVTAGGNLAIRNGTYAEPVFLYKSMRITAENGPVTISPPTLGAFDVVVDRVDANGLPLNPRWAGQLRPPFTPPDPAQCPNTTDILAGRPHTYRDIGRSPCSNQFSYKSYGNPQPVIGPICGPHLNWFPVTYEGTVTWNFHSCDAVDDDNDFVIDLTRPDQAGYSATRPNLHCEFDAGETMNRFASPWWTRFRNSVADDDRVYGCGHSPPDPSEARAILGGTAGSFAIITALFNFDTEHDGVVELHPVWAMAVNESDSTLASDRWALFARNWGNQGFCGHDQTFAAFPNNQYTFHLPWKAGASAVSVTSANWHRFSTQAPEPTVSIVPREGVYVTFTLDPPRDQGSMWDGELILSWTPG